MAASYERCAACGCEYEREFMRRIGERLICAMCLCLRAAGSRRRDALANGSESTKHSAGARR